ncbi:unnamed protein product [Closterium sp. NIES-65]|nr:unnamed protein product [Closterium sp. NIES-65]
MYQLGDLTCFSLEAYLELPSRERERGSTPHISLLTRFPPHISLLTFPSSHFLHTFPSSHLPPHISLLASPSSHSLLTRFPPHAHISNTLTCFHLTLTELFGALCVWLGYLSGQANIPLWDTRNLIPFVLPVSLPPHSPPLRPHHAPTTPPPPATTLTGFHLTFTGLFGALCVWLGYLSGTANIPLWDIVWFGMLANLSIVGMNLSLMSNSVGFYQISKLAIIPVTCLCETLLHAKAYSREVKLSVVAVMLGVGVCTVTDISVNAFGLVTATVAVVSTSLQQIFVGELQRKHNVGSFDLLRQTAPIQAVTLVIVGPFLDYLLTSQNLLEFPVTSNATFFISLSCAFAIGCNLSVYLCIGKFSATSFQVLGHMKTVVVLILGWTVFKDPFTLKNFSGMLMAIVGMLLYSWAVEKEKGTKEGKGGKEALPLLPVQKGEEGGGGGMGLGEEGKGDVEYGGVMGENGRRPGSPTKGGRGLL